MNTENHRDLFEIQDSELNIQEIILELESTIKNTNINLEDISRITNLKPKNLTEKNQRFFDPALTANLFEKGVSPPKFTNPSLWFIKGPLKWVLVKFIEAYSLFDKKVSDNRIKAFYSVVHELVDLKKKHDILSERFEELHQDYISLKCRIDNVSLKQAPFPNSIISPNITRKFNDRVTSSIGTSESMLVLYPDQESLLKELELSNIHFLGLTEDKEQFNYFRLNITDKVEHIDSIINFTEFHQFTHIVFSSNASLFPGWLLQKIIYNILKYANSETKIFLKYANSSLTQHSPFQEVYRTRIVPDLLVHNLREMGFKNVTNHTVDEDEYNLITFQKA